VTTSNYFLTRLETGYRENYSGVCDIDYSGGVQPDYLHLYCRKERPRFQLFGPILVWSISSSYCLCPDTGIFGHEVFMSGVFLPEMCFLSQKSISYRKICSRMRWRCPKNL